MARRILLAAGLTLAAVVLAEVGVRATDALGGEAWSAQRGLARMRATIHGFDIHMDEPGEGADDAGEDARRERSKRVERAVVANPYFGFYSGGGHANFARTIADLAPKETRTTFDLLVLGGSVAGRTATSSADRLAQRLQEDTRLADREVRVFNRACGGFKQPQQLNLLAYLLVQGCRPDAVLLIDGFNEVALGAHNVSLGAHPLQPSLGHWKQATGAATDVRGPELELLLELAVRKRDAERLLARVERWGLQHSALGGHLAQWRLAAARSRLVTTQLEYEALRAEGERRSVVAGPQFQDRGDLGSTLIARSWYEASRSMHALCATFGVPFVHALQPNMHDPGSKPLSRRELRAGKTSDTWIEGVRMGYPKLRSFGKRLVEQGIAFVDASFLFRDVEETLYFDPCHFNRAGTDMLADVAVERLLELLP